MTRGDVQTANSPGCSLSFGRTAAPTAVLRHELISTARVEDHPVFAALFEDTRDRLLSEGRHRALDIGEALEGDQQVVFVLEGIVGGFVTDQRVCVALSGAGGVIGLESALGMRPSLHAVALAETRIFEAPATLLVDGLGRARVTDLCMRHALARLDQLHAEAVCNAIHLIPQRLAKWLERLHRANRGKDIRLTQAEIATLMGVQRTAVNGSLRQLQDAGILKSTRGRISVADVDQLARASCGCPV